MVISVEFQQRIRRNNRHSEPGSAAPLADWHVPAVESGDRSVLSDALIDSKILGTEVDADARQMT